MSSLLLRFSKIMRVVGISTTYTKWENQCTYYFEVPAEYVVVPQHVHFHYTLSLRAYHLQN